MAGKTDAPEENVPEELMRSGRAFLFKLVAGVMFLLIAVFLAFYVPNGAFVGIPLGAIVIVYLSLEFTKARTKKIEFEKSIPQEEKKRLGRANDRGLVVITGILLAVFIALSLLPVLFGRPPAVSCIVIVLLPVFLFFLYRYLKPRKESSDPQKRDTIR